MRNGISNFCKFGDLYMWMHGDGFWQKFNKQKLLNRQKMPHSGSLFFVIVVLMLLLSDKLVDDENYKTLQFACGI
jgi:hypothetical protein